MAYHVSVQETVDGVVAIAAIDPSVSMAALNNPAREEIVATIGEKLRTVIARR